MTNATTNTATTMNTSTAEIIKAIHSLLASSPRLCELADKAKSVGLEGDEAEEYAALRKLNDLIA
jgi:hypothetical protein